MPSILDGSSNSAPAASSPVPGAGQPDAGVGGNVVPGDAAPSDGAAGGTDLGRGLIAAGDPTAAGIASPPSDPATVPGGDIAPAEGDASTAAVDGGAAAAGGPATQTISGDAGGDTGAEPGETSAAPSGPTDRGGTATPGTTAGAGATGGNAAITPIYAIQGSGDASPLAGQTVTTRGVVTAISDGSSKGFYIQDAAGDGDAATSDGVFVFTGSTPAGIAVGDLVDVTGRVLEFLPRNAAPGSLPTTQISAVAGIATLSRGDPLPAAAVIGSDGLQIPTADFAAANAFYERLEGMLVTVRSPLVVGPTSRFGEVFTVASGGADATGLNDRGDLLIAGGTPAFGSTDAVGGDFNPERVQIDPGLGVTLPRVSTGASLGDVTGVVTYDFGNYQVSATAAPAVVRESPLTKDAATLTGDADHLLVGSYNAENLDPGDGPTRFDAIAGEVIGKLNAPDIVALQEVQDNSGPTDDGVTSASVTLQTLVDAIAAAGGPRYAYLDNPFIGDGTNGGEPGGNIRVAFLYRTDRVGFVDGSLATVAADGGAIASGTYADQQTDPDNPFYDSRPPLSATFTFNGQSVTVVNNHFTSKGGSGALYGSVQPPFNAGEVQRAAQAQAVNAYVDGLLAADPGAGVIVAGDLNEFGFEQPLAVLEGVATVTGYDVPGTDPIAATATYTPGGVQVLYDLQDTLPPERRFDYVFEGNAQTLDHMLVTGALAPGAAFEPVHINAEFYDQTSDHDPLVGRFAIPASTPAPPGVPGGTGTTETGGEAASAPLDIVLTNDDGYDAPGIRTLYDALVSAGFNVRIVAPAANQSAQGSSLGGTAALSGPIAVTEFSPGNFYVEGRPAVATLTALGDLFAGAPPDLVISGTNRGENIGQGENISGTVNAAVQGLFEGVPAIAVSAGSSGGGYDAAFANSANFVVDLLHRLQQAREPGQPLLPAGRGLSINVPGDPVPAGVAVTTITPESSAAYPYAPTGPDTYAQGFVPNPAPSGSPTAEGSRFLTGYITISPIDGNWGSTQADRDALAVRLGSSPGGGASASGGSTAARDPLDILLLNEDGHDAAGLDATRDALLAAGHDVTVLAPATDQGGVGSALSLAPVTVTRHGAGDYAATGTPTSLVALGLDPQGLFGGARPGLVVVGADRGDAVGVENANHSATVAAAATALFNYGVPSIALSTEGGTAADFATGADFLTALVADLQATQGSSPTILPAGVGLSINVPAGASAGGYAFTTIDGATDADLTVTGDAGAATFAYDGAVASANPSSEGNAFDAGKITVSPLDGGFAVRDPDAYASLARAIGTTYGTPSDAPDTISFQVSGDSYQGDPRFVVTVNGRQIGGAQTVTASHAAGEWQTVTLLDFFDDAVASIGVQFINDPYGGTPSTDRNLYVDKLTLNGRVSEGELATNTAGVQPPTEAALFGNGGLVFDHPAGASA